MTTTGGAGWRNLVGAVLLAAGVAACGVAANDPAELAGDWDAVVVVGDGVEVPFRFEVADQGGQLTGSFFNGERRISSTSAGLWADRPTSTP